jgi:hypothetical protein
MDREAKPSSSTTKSNEPPGHEVFCTPENSEFLSKIHYEDLSTSNREIRLLKFLPDTGSDFVECELLPSVRLADVQKQYLALSYCAGDPRNTKAISVNGITCNVFSNLHHALRTVRNYWKTRGCADDLLLWVDQICINQFNLAERSHQVGFMRDIYQNAIETFICLSVTETKGQGMKWFVQLVQDFAQHQEKEHSHELHTDVQVRKDKAYCCLDFGNYFCREILGDGCYEFLYVLTSPWWGRAWVYQEFLVSNRVRFFFGKYSIACEEMAPFLLEICNSVLKHISIFKSGGERLSRFMESSQYTWDDLEDSIGRTYGMIMTKEEGVFHLELKDLLMNSGSSRASDARDKVFSVLGLARPDYGIAPDYSPENDLNKVLIETTRKIIEFEDSLDVLTYSGLSNPPNHNRKDGLPSWVVDWTAKNDPFRSSHARERAKKAVRLIFKADKSGASFLQLDHPEDPKKTTTVLEVWGTLLDDVMPEDSMYAVHDAIPDDKVRRKRAQLDELFRNGYVAEREDKVWILRGGSRPFLLKKFAGGYRLQGTYWLPLLDDVIQKRLKDFIDEAGHFHASKLRSTRIRIF